MSDSFVWVFGGYYYLYGGGGWGGRDFFFGTGEVSEGMLVVV